MDYTFHGILHSMEFSRPEYCSGYPFPSPGDLPDPGIKPGSPALQANSLPAELWLTYEKTLNLIIDVRNVNQGHNKIPFYIHYMDKYLET